MKLKRDKLKKSLLKRESYSKAVRPPVRWKFRMPDLYGTQNGLNILHEFNNLPGLLKVVFPSKLFKSRILCFLLLFCYIQSASSQVQIRNIPNPGYEKHIKELLDSIRIVDTHEHLLDPVVLGQSNLLDFMLLLHQFNNDDFISSGLLLSNSQDLVNPALTPKEKWTILEPFWKNSLNTTYNRIALLSIQKLYGIDDINESTVDILSKKIREAYQTDWFNHVLKDLCRIDYIIQDGDYRISSSENILYAKRFTSWLTVRTKYRIDSIAIMQVEPIKTLEEFILSMENAFKEAVRRGIVAIKINLAYNRTLNFENVPIEIARKVFQTLIKGEENHQLSYKDAKPLQDFMFHRLLTLADSYNLPVVIHTGMQSGNGNFLENSNPTLLTNIFTEYPNINFALFHASYPFGGELSVLAKNFRNVYIDMSWVYAISPSYSERYLHEWLETVPANKIMAFGGDLRCVENVYGELLIAKQVIAKVLTDKVRDGYLSEQEALTIAQMLLHDNAMKFYHLPPVN
jgi:uncharacterized protein